LAHLARDDKLSPPLTGQILIIPTILDAEVVPQKYQAAYLSQEQNKDAPFIPKPIQDMFMGRSQLLQSAPMLTCFIGHYKPDRSSPKYVPFNHPQGHAGLPKAYFQVCGMDPLRDDSLIYEKVLREECDIETRMDLYKGLPHHFWILFPALRAAEKQRNDLLSGLEWILK